MISRPARARRGASVEGRSDRLQDAQGRMTGAPQPFWLFQGIVSMWSVNVWPKTSLLLGGGVLGLELLMT
jgi:hypothetical protein